MNALQVGRFGAWLKDSPFADDTLFRRPLNEVSETEIQLFHARASLRGLKKDSVQAIERLQADLLMSAKEGTLPGEALRLISHELPQHRYTVDEFMDNLTKLPPVRRLAVLFALTTKTPIERMVGLEWNAAKQLSQLPELARDVLKQRGRMRHFKLAYVFWEMATEKIAAPLLNLESEVCVAFGDTWPGVQQRWNQMIWISGRMEGSSFLSLVEEIEAGKL